MKQFLLVGFFVLALGGIASAQTFAYTNQTTLISPPAAAPQIDTLHFINLAPFEIGLPGSIAFDFSDVLTFTNRSLMFSLTGFTFDNAPSGFGARGASQSFGNANQGVIEVASDATPTSFVGLIFPGSPGSPELDIYATNIVNTGLLDVGVTGVMKIGGDTLDLSKGTLQVETANVFGTNDDFVNGVVDGLPTGVFDVFYGIGMQSNVLSIRNFTIPNITSPINTVIKGGGQTFDTVVLTNATYYIFTTQINQSNISYQVVFINTNLPGITTDVRFEPGNYLSIPVIQWGLGVTNNAGLVTSNFLYLSDQFGNVPTNSLVTNGLTLTGGIELAPSNYMFFRSFPGYGGLPMTNFFTQDVRSVFASAFPTTNAYSAYGVNVEPASFVPDATSAISSFTNLPGRIEITASNSLDLTRATIAGANYLNIIASNNFVGSAGAQIVVPTVDLNVGSTNGSLVISNLVAPLVPGFTGPIDMWSGRWTNTDSTGITNTYHVFMVHAQLAPSSRPQVENFAARSTNTLTHTGGEVIISDILNITNSLLIQAQTLILTTNDLSSPNPTGQINLVGGSIDFSLSLPILQNLTNWGVITVQNNADFVGNRQPPYFTNSFSEPYLSFVNHGLIQGFGITVSALHLENTGAGALLSSVDAPINLEADTAILTNDIVLAIGGDISISANNLLAINHVFQTDGALTLSVSNTVTDGGAVSGNFWQAGEGINLLVKPAMGDFLGTTVTLTAPPGLEVDSVWAGLNLGASPAGFANNGALGHLILDGGDNLSQFFFGPSDGATNHALYVDQIELQNGATNRATGDGGQNFTAFDLAPDFIIYYADATEGGFDISEKLMEGNNHQLVWVPAFAGIFSSTNLVDSAGHTNTFNRALVMSETIDSNGNGVANAFDPNPIFTADDVNLAITVTNSVTNAATKIATIQWAGLANSSNYLFYRSNLVSTNWVQVFSTNQGPVNGPIIVKRTNSAGFYKVQVNPLQP